MKGWQKRYTHNIAGDLFVVTYSKANARWQIVASLVIGTLLIVINQLAFHTTWFTVLSVLIITLTIFSNIRHINQKYHLTIDRASNQFLLNGKLLCRGNDVVQVLVETDSPYKEGGELEVYLETKQGQRLLVLLDHVDPHDQSTLLLAEEISRFLMAPYKVHQKKWCE